MKKVNFNSLKSLKAPESWVEKAAAIPDLPPGKKRRRALPAIPYRYAAAASPVLASVIGLVVFLMLQRGASAPLTRGDLSDTQAQTAYAEGTYASEAADTPTGAKFDPTVDGSESPSAFDQPTGAWSGPSEAVSETASVPSASSETVPAQKPTRSVLQTEPPSPTQVPPTVRPDPHPTAPPETAPPLPPATQPPTESYKPPGDCEIYGTFSLGTAGGSGNYAAEDTTIFCKLYDSAGNLVGDSGLYSPQREAEILSLNSDGSVFAYYNPVEKGLYITEDCYVYVFYDIHDNELYRDVKFVF